MQTDTRSTRHYQLSGPGNFRDIGGYSARGGKRTRWQRLFRSDSLHRLSDADLEALRAEGISIAAAIDLRTVRELEAGGTGPAIDRGARHIHLPFVELVRPEGDDQQFESIAALYVDMIERAHDSIRLAFEALAEPDNYPAVYYCSAGKDRTGMLTALLLSALGVDRSDIVADYSLTDLHMHVVLTERVEKARQERLERQAAASDGGDAAPHEAGATRALTPDLFRAHPETMQAFLDHLDANYGSPLGYLERAGVTTDNLASLEALLLE